MKKYLIALLAVMVFVSARSQNTDLPGPDANLQSLANGSYVIAMDNTLQLNTAGDFNLKAYGLVVYLLNNNVRIKWSIKAGKLKDGIDFTGTAEQLKPTLVSGGVSRSFKAGPFVIDAADTTGVAALIDAFYTANALTGNNRPKVYRLTATAVDVDIRYDLSGFHPKAAILTDGGNQNIHIAYMTAASIPSTSYATSPGTDLATGCYTFATEPHNSNSGTTVDNTISEIRHFVMRGGNFLAQCDAVVNYENNPLGRFQTTTGITTTNANIGTSINYGSADLSFSQFDGAYNGSLGGSIKNWKVIDATTSNDHNHATGIGTNSGNISASVSKLVYGKGGLVFYVGNHSFPNNTAVGINGIRMYLNAFLTPSNTDCPSLFGYSYLAVRLAGFSVQANNNVHKLKWIMEENESAKSFDIERSYDGRIFETVSHLNATAKAGKEVYDYDDATNGAKAFYRIRIIDVQGKITYSNIILAGANKHTENSLTIFHTASEDLAINYLAGTETNAVTNIYNTNGLKIYSIKIRCLAGMNSIVIPHSVLTIKGIYIIEVIDSSSKIRLVAKAMRL